MTITETTKVIAILQGVWPNHPFSAESPAAYHAALADLDFTQVQAATTLLLQSETFCPVPATIRAKVRDLTDPQISESAAWDLVLKGCRESMNNVGYPGETKFRRLIGEWLPGEQGEAVANAACRLGLEPILNNYQRMMTPFFKALKDTQTELQQRKDRVAIGANGAKELRA